MGKPSEAKMEKRKIFINRLSDEPGFYDQIFHKNVTADELLLPHVVLKYLYNNFNIGYRPQNAKKTKRLAIQTHGNLTVLALVGHLFQEKYNLKIPIRDENKRILTMLINRFHQQNEHAEFFKTLDKTIMNLLNVLERWLKRTLKLQEKNEGLQDVRKIFVTDDTIDNLLNDKQVKKQLERFASNMPSL